MKNDYGEGRPMLISLLAGGIAGTSVDISLFPLDTIKTRLQSSVGFRKSGGFSGIYKGISSAALGSFPSAAVFFCSYECSKVALGRVIHKPSVVHMASASIGEMAACIIRVPTEVVKQRAQAYGNMNSYTALLFTIKEEGLRGLYRGYFNTVVREVPFSFIQFPIWEFLKTKWSIYQGSEVSAWQSGVAGSISGATAGAITTPLDVVKTRVMLAKKGSSTIHQSMFQTMMKIRKEEGAMRLFSGIAPRVIWLSVGGFVFLGAYDKARNILFEILGNNSSSLDVFS